MYHKYAAIFNKVTGKSRMMTADEFEKNLRKVDRAGLENDPLYERSESFVRKTYDFVSVDDAKPLTFSKKHTRMGNETIVSAYFSYAAGHGVKDHLYDRNKKRTPESLESAIKNGKRVLFSVGLNTSHKPLNFRAMQGFGGTTLNKFLNKSRGNKIVVSVRSAEELVSKIDEIKAMCPSLKNFEKRTFALYRGGVLPYAQFDLRGQSLQPLFKQVYDLESGVLLDPKKGKRAIGFPRLITFKPTSTMVQYPFKGYPKGNVTVSDSGREMSMSTLTFPQKNIRETLRYNQLVEDIVNRKKDVFVLSSPSITIPRPKRTAKGVQWELLRWNVGDIAAQTFAQDKESSKGHGGLGGNAQRFNDGASGEGANDNGERQSARAAGYLGAHNQMSLFSGNIYAPGPGQ